MPQPRPRASRADARAAIRQIRTYYKIGRWSLRRCPDQDEWKQGMIKDQVVKLKGMYPAEPWNDTKVRKARQFADPDRGYSERQLSELCNLLREHRPLFGVAFIGILVTVARPLRDELQRACIENNWSKSTLIAEIKLHRTNQRQGGRRRRIDRDPRRALVMLEELTDTWQRWVKVAGEQPEHNGKKSLLDQLPRTVREWTTEVTSAVGRLRAAVTRELARIRSE